MPQASERSRRDRYDSANSDEYVPWSLAARVHEYYAYLILAAALLLGGGTQHGLWSDAAVQLACLPLLAMGLAANARAPSSGLRVGALGIVGATVLLPALQLISLPPSVWQVLPGRTAVTAVYGAAGMPLPYLPVSLSPPATLRSFLSILPAVAIFLAASTLGPRARRGSTLVVLAVALASVFLDLAQMLQGPTSPLRFFRITNQSQAVGFFANRNHNAAMLYCALAFAPAWAIGLIADRRANRLVGVVLVLMVMAAALLGLGMARSRTGLVLAFVASLAAIPLALTCERDRKRRRTMLLILAGANLLGLLLAFQFGFVVLAERLETDKVVDDFRWQMAKTTWQAISAYFPFGTGLGTFQRIFETFEVPAMLHDAYVNHAHDDWLELGLEGGVPALVVMAGFLAWFAIAAVAIWRTSRRRISALDLAIAQAGSIVAALLLLHSAADYPLRTTALMTLLALALGLMLPPPETDRSRAAQPARRHRTALPSKTPRGLAGAESSTRRR